MFTILNVKILYQGKYENRISFKSFQSRSRRGSFQPDDMFPRGIRTPDLRYCVNAFVSIRSILKYCHFGNSMFKGSFN